MQRVVKTLNLSPREADIAAYREAHRLIWPEITAGIRQVGITAMDIYLSGNRAVMIIEAPDDLDLDAAMARLATLPRQAEWEEHVAQYQQCNPGDTSAEKWKLMQQIFSL